MNIVIIGGGNMGGAIARCMYQHMNLEDDSLTVIDPNESVLKLLANGCPKMALATAIDSSASNVDLFIIAVKPWLVEGVLTSLSHYVSAQNEPLVASIAAGVTLEQLSRYSELSKGLFRIIPNTAISLNESMTFIASKGATVEQNRQIEKLFGLMGRVEVIEEKLMSAATALSSCGLAYALRYIRAASQAGVEVGFSADKSKEFILQTLKGAIALLENNHSHPEQEIDKITTPGGITIKGLNAMEEAGFTNAVIQGIKKSKID